MSTDRGEGPVALLLHGQPGQGSDWDDVAAGLASSNRVLVPDRPGYGRTGGPAVGLAANADSLDCLLDDKGVGSATVVGHSFGGGVALAMALRHGHRVRALVLVDSVGTGRSIGPYDRVLGLPGLPDVRGLGAVAAAAAGPAAAIDPAPTRPRSMAAGHPPDVRLA